ncbi:MAG: efflux RND transporter periplasmic adaptor subunit [Bacteroidia bacterium]|nr:efflux RND transporter periplasmic adaptor subunit [Bacteroidia bacterium]
MKYYLIILATIFITSCGNKVASEDPKETALESNIVQMTDVQQKNSGITAERIEKKSISSLLKVNGVIDVPPQNMVSISVPLGGYLKSSKLLPGMRVAKGEVIAVMEDQQYIQIQQEYLTARANFSYLESEFNRQKELNQSKATSDKSFQKTEAEYKSQQILIKSLFEKLKLIGINPEGLNESSLSRSINVYSPIDGFVSTVNVNIGKYVNPTEVLFNIVNPTDIHLALTVFEKDVNKISNGQKVIAYTNNNPEKRYAAEVILIGQDLSQERSVIVHCHFNDYDKALIPGMFMNGEIEIKNDNAYVISENAVVTFEGKHFVFIERDKNTFEMCEVESGISEHGMLEIKSTKVDLGASKIVVKGAYHLLMKMKNTEE